MSANQPSAGQPLFTAAEVSVNDINLRQIRRSILQVSPLSPVRRIKVLLESDPSFIKPTFKALAALLDRTEQHLNQVLKGKRPSPPIQQRIAELWDVDVKDIWPPEPNNDSASKMDQS